MRFSFWLEEEESEYERGGKRLSDLAAGEIEGEVDEGSELFLKVWFLVSRRNAVSVTG